MVMNSAALSPANINDGRTVAKPSNSNNGRSLSTADKAALIRAELKKAHGWTSRDVSVRSDVYSMGSTLRIKIKAARVSLTSVRMVAKQFENVHRDEITGEILCGGNTHLDVEYCDELVDAVAAPLEATIPEDGTSATVGEHVVHRGNSGDEDYYFGDMPGNDDPRKVLRCWGKARLAAEIAIRLLDAGMVSL